MCRRHHMMTWHLCSSLSVGSLSTSDCGRILVVSFSPLLAPDMSSDRRQERTINCRAIYSREDKEVVSSTHCFCPGWPLGHSFPTAICSNMCVVRIQRFMICACIGRLSLLRTRGYWRLPIWVDCSMALESLSLR